MSLNLTLGQTVVTAVLKSVGETHKNPTHTSESGLTTEFLYQHVVCSLSLWREGSWSQCNCSDNSRNQSVLPRFITTLLPCQLTVNQLSTCSLKCVI